MIINTRNDLIDATLTENFLDVFDACKEGRDFAKVNKLIGCSLLRLSACDGEHEGFAGWIKDKIEYIKEINDGLITKTVCYDCVTTYEYDENQKFTKIVVRNKNNPRQNREALYTYENGLLVKTMHYGSDGTLDRVVDYGYNGRLSSIVVTGSGNPTKSYMFGKYALCDVFDTVYIGTSFGAIKSDEHELQITVGDNGDICTAVFGDIKVVVEYKTEGNRETWSEVCYENETITRKRYSSKTLDSNGNIIRLTQYIDGVCIRRVINRFNNHSDKLVDVNQEIITTTCVKTSSLILI